MDGRYPNRSRKSFVSIYRRGSWLAFCLPLASLGCGSGSGQDSNSAKPFSIPGNCSSGPTQVNINRFLENPLTGSGQALAYTSDLSASYTTDAVISGLSGNCLLQNENFLIASDSLFPAHIAVPTNANMRFSPSRPEFRQLNAFYYASSLADLLISLGANLSGMGRVKIDAHCNISSNAFFSPLQKRVCLGYVPVSSTKQVWAADDADVVVHEAGHAVNHALASTSIMNSSREAAAVDEAVADYWALTVLGDAQLSEWFLGALGGAYIRDANGFQQYPGSMVSDIHDDSRVISQALWDLRKNGNLGKSITDGLVKRALQLLPATSRFGDFYQAVYDASGPAFLNLSPSQRALIVSKFTEKGIHRVDDAAALRLSTVGGQVKQVYVIDDYRTSVQSNGNCNGQLDVNETALVLVNLENAGDEAMGVGLASLSSVPAGIQVPSGGAVGEFFRFNASSDFVSSLPMGGANREEAVYWASFLIGATTAGVKDFSLRFVPMYSDATGLTSAGADRVVSFSLAVGASGPDPDCDAAALWP